MPKNLVLQTNESPEVNLMFENFKVLTNLMLNSITEAFYTDVKIY